MSDIAMPRDPAVAAGERAVFFRHWLRHPLWAGAILPSTNAVARRMARAVDITRPGRVLELGGGTGSVTAALLEAGWPEDRLLVIEREAALARLLRRRFSGAVDVMEGDARDIGGLLARRGIRHLAGVVSSLPIKWFPLADQRAVIEPCLALMGAGGAFVQLTNAFVSPVPMARLGIAGSQIARVWGQVPPVQIWRYRRAAER